MSDWCEAYGYYDGMISGCYSRDGQLHYFGLKEDSPMYPSEGLDIGGRLYSVWRIDAEPAAEDVANAFWVPPGAPDFDITEDELLEIPFRPYQED